MSDETHKQPAGWYYAQGDAAGTQRYWDGNLWQGEPQPVPGETAWGTNHSETVPAGIGRRVVARIVDVLVWVGMAVVVAIPTGVFMALAESDLLIRTIGQVLVGVFIAVYETAMVTSRGGTVGKLLLGLKITTKDGQPVDMQSAIRRVSPLLLYLFARNIPVLGIILVIVLPLAGAAMLLRDSSRQTPWDKLGKTVVVNG